MEVCCSAMAGEVTARAIPDTSKVFLNIEKVLSVLINGINVRSL
jgi:hypothetical protein